jgi:HPt (histidine-containing phosphotransfer) domain-containing protein
MNDEDRLKQQMAQIGTRYLGRTLGEMQRMHELLQSALNGSPAMMKDLEHLAHKIHGSGAMFGFDLVSDHAAQIEHLAGFLHKGEGPEHFNERFKTMSEQQLHTELRDSVAKLDEVTRAAAKERGIELNAS